MLYKRNQVIVKAARPPAPPMIPKRPSSYLTGSYQGRIGTWITHYDDDNHTVTKVEFSPLGGSVFTVPHRPKPKWYEFWRMWEIDPYYRW